MDTWRRQRLYSHLSKVNLKFFSSYFDAFTALRVLPLAQHLPCREGRQPCTFLRFSCFFVFGYFCSMFFHLFLGRTWPSGCLAQNTPVMNFMFPNIVVYLYQFVNLGDLVNSKCIVIGLVSRHHWRVGGQRIVDSRIRHLRVIEHRNRIIYTLFQEMRK